MGYLLSGQAASRDCGVIEIEKGGRVSYVNEEAQHALQGMDAYRISGPGLKGDPSFLKNGRFLYRVHTIPTNWDSVEKTIILEPCAGGDDLYSKLSGHGLTRRQEEVAALTVRGLA